MLKRWLIIATAAFLAAGCASNIDAQWNEQAIQPYPKNPRYWQYRGEPVLLLGGSKTDHLFLADSLEEHLDEIQATGANYVRNTMSQREDVTLKPFKLLADGTFDLDQWNEVYWQRFADFLKWTRERDIIVQIEVWDRFDYSTSHWQRSPWRPAMNVNYTGDDTGLADVYPEQPYKDLQPFFHSIPDMPRYDPKLDRVRRYQEKFVDKMLSYSLNYGNVLYCMNNETSTPPEWGRYWMRYIREKAQEKSRVVYTTDMFDRFFYPHECPSCLAAIQDTRMYTFLDISQINSRYFQQTHWDTLQWILQERDKVPLRPANNTKVYGGDHTSWGSGSHADGIERFCRDVIGGCASARHHRPPSGNGLNDLAKASIKALRVVERSVQLWDVAPKMDLLLDRGENEAYVTAREGHQYVVYFPEGGDIRLNLNDYPNEFSGTWISVGSGSITGEFTLRGGSEAPLATPDSTGWLAVIVRRKTFYDVMRRQTVN